MRSGTLGPSNTEISCRRRFLTTRARTGYPARRMASPTPREPPSPPVSCISLLASLPNEVNMRPCVLVCPPRLDLRKPVYKLLGHLGRAVSQLQCYECLRQRFPQLECAERPSPPLKDGPPLT